MRHFVPICKVSSDQLLFRLLLSLFPPLIAKTKLYGVKLFICDPCIFIDLCHADLISSFFLLNAEMHVVEDTFYEITEAHQARYLTFINSERLKLHCISSEDRIAICQTGYPACFSQRDKASLYLAKQLDAMVLSVEKHIRAYAGKHAIDDHGLLWLFDNLLLQSIFSKKNAIEKLPLCIMSNRLYSQNSKLMTAMKQRLEQWQL